MVSKLSNMRYCLPMIAVASFRYGGLKQNIVNTKHLLFSLLGVLLFLACEQAHEGNKSNIVEVEGTAMIYVNTD